MSPYHLEHQDAIIVTCSRCQQSYLVEQAHIQQAFQNVRCNHCGYAWKHDFSAYCQVPSSAKKITSISRARQSWGKFFRRLIFWAIMGAGVWYSRDYWSAKWPDYWHKIQEYVSSGLLSHNGFFLIEDLKIQANQDKQTQNHAIGTHVSGKIINMTDQNQPLPALKISEYGACEGLSHRTRLSNFFKPYAKSGGLCLHSRWEQAFAQKRLKAHEKIYFSFTVPRTFDPHKKLIVHP